MIDYEKRAMIEAEDKYTYTNGRFVVVAKKV